MPKFEVMQYCNFTFFSCAWWQRKEASCIWRTCCLLTLSPLWTRCPLTLSPLLDMLPVNPSSLWTCCRLTLSLLLDMLLVNPVPTHSKSLVRTRVQGYVGPAAGPKLTNSHPIRDKHSLPRPLLVHWSRGSFF